METRGTREFTESVQEFQQQFQRYKDISSKRFQEIEDLIDLATQKMEILLKKKLTKKGVTALVNTFAKMITEEDEEVSDDSQKIQQHRGVFRNPQHAAFKRQKSDFNIGNNTDDFHQQQTFSLHDTKKTVTTGTQRVGAYSTTCQGSSYTAVPTARDPRGSPYNQSQPAENNTSNARPLTFAQREEKRQRGLCPYCDDKFTKGHECKEPQHFTLIAEIPEVEEYEGSPKFDEEPGENLNDRQNQEIILAALGMQSLQNSQSSMQFIGMEQGRPIKDFTTDVWVADWVDGNVILGLNWLSTLGDLHGNCVEQTLQFQGQGHNIQMLPHSQVNITGSCHQLFTVIPLWMKQLLQNYTEDSGSPTANPYGEGSIYMKFDEHNVLIFDPGGSRKISSGLSMLTKEEPAKYLTNNPHKALEEKQMSAEMEHSRSELIGYQKKKLDEVASTNSVCDQLGHLQWWDEIKMELLAIKLLCKDSPQLRYKVFLAGIMVISHGHDPGKVMRLEVLRRNVTIYIYDPGGDSSCLHGVSASILNTQQVLKDVFKAKSSYLQGKDLLDSGVGLRFEQP